MIPRSERRVWIPSENGIGRKSDYRENEARGAFGNVLRSWPNLETVNRVGYRGWLRISSRKPSSPHKINEVHWTKLEPAILSLIERGARAEDMIFGEVPAPDNPRLLNFEVIRTPKYLNLDWGIGQRPLRDDLNLMANAPVTGLKALTMLKFYLGDEFDTLEGIWDRFPSAATEGTVFGWAVGTLTRHLVVWEAREF